jgi:hypothetical protein
MKKMLGDSYTIVSISALLITVSMTPWLNDDSLIIPKQIILFATALFFLPRCISKYRKQKNNRLPKFLALILILILIQMLLVILNSEAPIEQQIFGRTGRGLGFLTEFSLLIIFLISYQFAQPSKMRNLFYALIAASLISTAYSLMQRFNFDFIEWNTRTNGIIGTLGNPNFQSSFAAMTLVPAFFYFRGMRYGNLISAGITIPLLMIIYFAESTQGYVAAFISISTYVLIHLWFQKRLFFASFLCVSMISGYLIVAGMLNQGPLSSYLYKGSIQSRGDMYRNTFSLVNDFPFFGVGLDSLGDFYLMYKDTKTVLGINEFTDNAHNIYLNYAAFGGYPLAILQLLLSVTVLYCFLRFMKNSEKFHKEISLLFSVWVCFQAQALISPANISMLTWNAILSGTLIAMTNFPTDYSERDNLNMNFSFMNPFSLFLFFIAIVFMYPYFNVDKMQQDSRVKGSGELAMMSAYAYPESTLRYSRIGDAFISANLGPQALEIGRAAARFNPNAPSAWGLILVNNLAPRDERLRAKAELIRLDPTNTQVKDFVVP